MLVVLHFRHFYRLISKPLLMIPSMFCFHLFKLGKNIVPLFFIKLLPRGLGALSPSEDCLCTKDIIFQYHRTVVPNDLFILLHVWQEYSNHNL